MNIHSRIIRYYRPFRLAILGALGVLILSVGFNLLKPWPVKYVVDSLLAGDDDLPWWIPAETFEGALLMSVLALVGIHLIWGALNLVANFWLIRIGLNALVRLRGECFQKLQMLALRFHDRHPSGDLVYRVAYDTQAIQTFFNRGFGTVVGSCLTLIGIVLVMWQMNIFLTLLSLLVVPFLLMAILLFAGRVRQDSNRVQEEESRVLQRLNDSLLNIRLIRVLGRGGEERKQFIGACRQSLDAARALDRTNLISTWVVGGITALGGALLLYFGAREVQAGTLQVGDLWVFLSYLAMLYQPLEQLSYTAWAMEGAAAGAERVFSVLDDGDIEKNESDRPDLPALRGRIEFSEVDFSYDRDKPVLNRIQAVIEPGQTVAFVGGTGAGKTTLLSLVPRLYEPDSGGVLIDGLELVRYNRASLRSQISMVMQQTLLVNGSVRDNLLLARADATDDDCWEGLEQARAAEFVHMLEGKLDGRIGEQGARLSGGQRQRLGIARAFIRHSPILLLDEPTSSLDPRTEEELMEALENVSARPTTLLVTHRLSVVHSCDLIYVLKNGRIVESGTGPELLEAGGEYSELWQAGGFSSSRR